PPGQTTPIPPTGAVEIAVALFEDDTEELGAFIDFLKAAAKVGVEIFKFVNKDQVGDTQALKDELDNFFEALQNVLPTVNYLGLARSWARTAARAPPPATTSRRTASGISAPGGALSALGFDGSSYQLPDIRVFP